jgi:hypothetical protein
MDFSFAHLKDGNGATVLLVVAIVAAALLGIIALHFGFQGSVQL